MEMNNTAASRMKSTASTLPDRDKIRMTHHKQVATSRSSRVVGATVAITAGLLLLLSTPTASQQQQSKSNYFYDIPGDYCETRSDKCCLLRQDDCSVPIMGTRCYCDEFCKRVINPDCCPDYPRVCLGVTTPPPEQKRCYHDGRYYQQHEKTQDNCNSCECGEHGDMQCSNNKCLVNPELLQQLQGDLLITGGGGTTAGGRALTWKATNYSMFWGKELNDGMLHKTGTHDTTTRLYPIHLPHNRNSIPTQFDARNKWPNWISRPRDQGWCGSSWAFSTITVATDRLAIESHGHEIVMLSPQNLISCDTKLQQGCEGGNLERAWHYLRRNGVVDEECYPYTSVSSLSVKEGCKIPTRYDNFTTIPCDDYNEVSERREKLYKAEPAYRIRSRESDIQYEIMTGGPVQAKMRVEQDFFYYRSGVYSSSGRSDPHVMGHHSVRIIGWGEEVSPYLGHPIKYWLVSNSWGEDWGEEGLFRILRGENESDIEDQILTVRMNLIIRYDESFYPPPSPWFYN
uniref:Uncharacterized peptidase C1-like protein F26E4.3 n=1 Tax=Hirondellea gigas TaxID=1518452 RepID=A0A6A7FPA7_9CRUS